MGNILAIGGGETFEENRILNTEIISLSKKKNPKILFIPTASCDAEEYWKKFDIEFRNKLKCKTNVLCLINDKPKKEEITDKILGSDIIYVGGGSTLSMMKLWRKFKVDEILTRAYRKGIVMSGLSAGGICWFKYGLSDSRRIKNPKADLIKVNALNFISAAYCPHYDSSKAKKDIDWDRKIQLKKMMKKNNDVALAFDNNCAIEIINRKFRIIASRKSANAYKIYWKNGRFYKNKIKKLKELKSIDSLIIKN